MLAGSMALAALGIDLMLPAFDDIRADLGLAAGSNEVTGLVTAYFIGMAAGQLFYGPLADRFGRRPTLYLGFAIYGVGALASALAPGLATLFAARLIWGFGAAGPRVVTLAVVRDSYTGEAMARAMSFIMAVFLLVPVIAPTLGSLLVAASSRRWMFVACAAVAVGTAIWAQRLPETLRPENRSELRFGRIAQAARHVVTNRQTVGYTLAMTSLYGVFTSYIASSEKIFSDIYDQEAAFPFLFGGAAGVMGLGMVINARVVERFGTRRLSHGVLLAYLVGASVLTAITLGWDGRPPLVLFFVGLCVMLTCHALLIPNFNTVALHPMGAVAGMASSVTGACQIAVGAFLGSFLDRAFEDTVTPLVLGFLGYGTLALALILWAERGRLFQRLQPVA
ncbi:MAG: multidrug effflux MFS transporter [Actinomycetota bacterium]|nr:multidrug effflux MFS transporter [Actinomycetota bacterium]